MTPPPGGPPDSTPPHIIVVQPESGAVLSEFKGDAVIRFDELIDEMGGVAGNTGGGTLTGLPAKVVLSPVAGRVEVSWHRTSIRVKPREGWKPGRVYHLQILPGITDLRHNVMKRGATVIFSTGPALPHAVLSGTVLQWVEQHAVPQALIRAALLPDTIAYVTIADSGGTFSLTGIPAGRYRIYAIQDQNTNRQLDPREPFDSATVTVDSSRSTLFWTFAHDTIGPRLHDAAPVDSLTFRLTFSSQLDPYHALDTAHVRLFALPDTTPVPLRAVWTALQFDSIQARERSIADSLRRARDTTAHGGGGGALKREAAPASPGAVGAGRAMAKADTGVARVDTARIRQLLRQRPVPTDRWVARAGTVLTPGGKYLVRVRGATNLSGVAADAQAVLAVPVPKPPAHGDTTRAIPPGKPR
jgi:Big-like domain-containing protein